MSASYNLLNYNEVCCLHVSVQLVILLLLTTNIERIIQTYGYNKLDNTAIVIHLDFIVKPTVSLKL